MSALIIFRGKAATGKSTVSSIISRKLGICVLRKDDIFDPLSNHLDDNQKNNGACYDILARITQSNLDNGVNVILDIALPNKSCYETFLSKLNLENHRLISILCDCSDKSVWLSRFESRLADPLPNQYFKSLDEIENHYGKMDISPIENEFYINSAENLDSVINNITACLQGIIR